MTGRRSRTRIRADGDRLEDAKVEPLNSQKRRVNTLRSIGTDG